MAKISSSNTKAEILRAYEDLLKTLQEERKSNTALQQELKKKEETVGKAVEHTKESASQSIQALRSALNKQLDEIEQGLSKEKQHFEEIQEAIKIEKQTLENLYKIKVEAGSLDALIINNKQAKDKLEKDFEEQKNRLREDLETSKLNWKREQDEYTYNLKQSRRKETDEYLEQKAQQEKELAEKKIAFEKEIADREKAIAEQEQEMAALRKLADGFEARLQSVGEEREKTVTQRLQQEFDYLRKLETKDLESALKLSQQEVENLKNKTVEQQALIDALSNKTDAATQQVKDIALRAIENAGNRPIHIKTEGGREDRRD